MSPTFRSLAVYNYRLYASGGLVSNIGTWMQRIAQDWLVLLLTGSSAKLGITTGLQFLPMLLFTAYAGVVADRFSKRRMLQVTKTMQGVTAAALGVLAVTGVVEVWHVYLMAFLFGVASAFDAPPRQAFVSEMVGSEDVTNAVGLNSASFNLARTIGPAIAGFLIGALGNNVVATGAVILLNAASYSAVIWTLQKMDPTRLHIIDTAQRGANRLRDGLAYVRSRPDVLLLLGIVFFAGTFGLNFQMISAVMASEVYGQGASAYGVLGSVLAVGSLTGALLVARRARIRYRLVVLSGVAFGAAEVIGALMPTYLAFLVWVPLIGLSAMTMANAANATVQVSVSPVLRGRVMALYMMVFMGGKPLGAPIIGWIGEAWGARFTLLSAGVFTLLGVLLSAALFSHTQGLLNRRPRGSYEPADVSVSAHARA